MAWGKGKGNKQVKKSRPKQSGRPRVRRARPMPKMNIKKLAYDIAKINCEKKEIGMYVQGLVLGQAFVVGGLAQSGHYMSTLFTPSPSNSTLDSGRVGDEITVTGMYNQLQFIQQSNAITKIRGRIYIVSPTLRSSYATATIDKFLNPNPITFAANGQVLYDLTSSRQSDNFQNWKVIRTMNFNVSPDLASTTQKMNLTIPCNLKFKKGWKVRYDSAGNVAEGQLYMVVVVDSGNASAVAFSGTGTGGTSGIMNTDTLSGLSFQYYSRAYYVDP